MRSESVAGESVAGSPDAAGRRFAIVASRYHGAITQRLVEGAVQTLTRHGASADAIEQHWAPGCFELPLLAQEVARRRAVDAVICIGCLIRGETPHFDFIAAHCAQGIGAASLQSGKPIAFGVITAGTMEQANERAGGKVGNKGAEAALAAIEMVCVLAGLGGE